MKATPTESGKDISMNTTTHRHNKSDTQAGTRKAKDDPRIPFMMRALDKSPVAYKLAGLLCWRYGNKGGAIFPSQETLADELGVTPRYVRDVIKRELVPIGLKVDIRRGPRTGTKMSYYSFGEADPDGAISELRDLNPGRNSGTEKPKSADNSGTGRQQFRSPGDNNSGTERSCNQKTQPKERTKRDPESEFVDSSSTRATQSEPSSISSLPAPKKTGGSRIADDWEPTPGDIDFARRKGLSEPDIENEVGRFHDYWLAANRPSAVKRDWAAAWRYWVRNAIQFRERDAARERARNGYRRRTPEDIADALEIAGANFLADQARWGAH